MAFGRRYAARFGGRFSSRSVRPGRPLAPTRTTSGRRPGGYSASRYSRMARGGFFKSIGRIVKSIAHVPIISALAKTAVSSLPILGRVQTAVESFKKKTAQGVGQSPVGAGKPTASQATNTAYNRKPKRRAKHAKRAKTAKRRPKHAKRAKTAKRGKRSGGGSPKQIAARKRFAAAARKGRIKKGARL